MIPFYKTYKKDYSHSISELLKDEYNISNRNKRNELLFHINEDICMIKNITLDEISREEFDKIISIFMLQNS